ncbi:hypothetical protein [Paenibacillus barcinonensis]|nr:hypothetical protein [Paenibacillus barcinonensis]
MNRGDLRKCSPEEGFECDLPMELTKHEFVRSYGGHDFMDWITVEKLNAGATIAFLNRRVMPRWASESIFDSFAMNEYKQNPRSLYSCTRSGGLLCHFIS